MKIRPTQYDFDDALLWTFGLVALPFSLFVIVLAEIAAPREALAAVGVLVAFFAVRHGVAYVLAWRRGGS